MRYAMTNPLCCLLLLLPLSALAREPYIDPYTLERNKEFSAVYGVFQGSCHCLLKFYPKASTSIFSGLSGFNITTPIGVQFLTDPDQRSGRCAFALSSTC